MAKIEKYGSNLNQDQHLEKNLCLLDHITAYPRVIGKTMEIHWNTKSIDNNNHDDLWVVILFFDEEGTYQHSDKVLYLQGNYFLSLPSYLSSDHTYHLSMHTVLP